MGGRGQGTATYPEANHQKMLSLSEQWSDGLSYDEQRDIRGYSGTQYADLNKWLRGGGTSGNSESKLKVKSDNISSAIESFDLPRNITVYRGADGRSIFGISLEGVSADYINNQFKGSILRDDGFGSSSIRTGSAFDKNAVYEIKVPKGKGRGAYIESLANLKSEREFLINKGTYYRIDGARMEGGKPVITMTILPKARAEALIKKNG